VSSSPAPDATLPQAEEPSGDLREAATALAKAAHRAADDAAWYLKDHPGRNFGRVAELLTASAAALDIAHRITSRPA
jgi:hypothetical protein